jgi:hypothetical protein
MERKMSNENKCYQCGQPLVMGGETLLHFDRRNEKWSREAPEDISDDQQEWFQFGIWCAKRKIQSQKD